MPVYSGKMGVSIGKGSDLDRLSRRLKALGGTPVQRKLHDGLRKAANPLPRAVKKAALTIPVHGDKHTGLRKDIANATKLSVRTVGPKAGATIVVSATKMPNKKRALPYLMEGLERWRHPFFGDRNRWYNQQSHPYFYGTINDRIPKVQEQMGVTLDEIAEDLAL